MNDQDQARADSLAHLIPPGVGKVSGILIFTHYASVDIYGPNHSITIRANGDSHAVAWSSGAARDLDFYPLLGQFYQNLPDMITVVSTWYLEENSSD